MGESRQIMKRPSDPQELELWIQWLQKELETKTKIHQDGDGETAAFDACFYCGGTSGPVPSPIKHEADCTLNRDCKPRAYIKFFTEECLQNYQQHLKFEVISNKGNVYLIEWPEALPYVAINEEPLIEIAFEAKRGRVLRWNFQTVD